MCFACPVQVTDPTPKWQKVKLQSNAHSPQRESETTEDTTAGNFQIAAVPRPSIVRFHSVVKIKRVDRINYEKDIIPARLQNCIEWTTKLKDEFKTV